MSLIERLRTPSLARRLVLLAVGWSFAALVISAVVLALLFQQAALRRFDAGLSDLIDNLIAGTTIEDGDVIAPALTDLRALRALSGRYWEVAEPGPDGRVRAIEGLTSRSLFDAELATPPDLAQRLRADPARPIAFDAPGGNPQLAAREAVRRLHELEYLAEGDRVLLTTGDHTGALGGTNTLKLLRVGAGGIAEGLGEL
mgnify:CR=1 FL=1